MIQLGLGEDARAEGEGFKFVKETREWVAEIADIIAHTDNTTEADIDIPFIEELLLMAIENGAEANPDSGGRGGGGGGFGGGGTGN